ncbi:hypothetical protein EB796_004359 [Bugula neritina]|uniref:FP protein C-terminal domain-containing protein n=1 Tax=Bugula neritina TaxID=10212 RepID=A0A7J7KIT5_BUGNE|nr:hypothetical protein EB796_004359 [Bugula neritina]
MKCFLKDFPDVKDRVDQLEFQDRKKQLTLNGIPQKSGENLLHAMKVMSEKLKCELQPYHDIDSIFRVKTSDKVIIKFIHAHKRDKFFGSFRKNPLNATDLGFKDNSKLYINEVLSKPQAALFHETRMFKKEHKYRFAWTSNQRIFLRKDSDSNAIQINSTDDLNDLA